MTPIITAILATLTLATSVYAKIGETRVDAETRWGKPAYEKGPVSYYYTENWMILQAYDEQGLAVICGYYRKEISNAEAQQFDLLNFPNVTAWTRLPDSGSPLTKQWISDDGQSCIIAGVTILNGVNVGCRMYLTGKGTEIAHSQGLADEPHFDIEKEATH